MKIINAIITDVNNIYQIEKNEFKYDSYTKSEIANILSNENNFSFILNIDKVCVGYILATIVLEEITILKIAIKKNYQNKGYGKLLLHNFIKYANQKQAKNIFIEVSENNLKAIKLYLQFNFKQVRIRNSYYKDGTNAIEMIKHI